MTEQISAAKRRKPDGAKGWHLDALLGWHYDVIMRTTVTLDADVADLVTDAMHRGRTSMKQVINAALRAALAKRPARSEPYSVAVHHAVLAPGLDRAGFNRLADQLEDAAVMDLARRSAQ